LAQPQAGNFYYAELICYSASNPRIALNSLEDPATQARCHPQQPRALVLQEPASRQASWRKIDSSRLLFAQ
jgi:hypothetical protein